PQSVVRLVGQVIRVSLVPGRTLRNEARVGIPEKSSTVGRNFIGGQVFHMLGRCCACRGPGACGCFSILTREGECPPKIVRENMASLIENPRNSSITTLMGSVRADNQRLRHPNENVASIWGELTYGIF